MVIRGSVCTMNYLIGILLFFGATSIGECRERPVFCIPGLFDCFNIMEPLCAEIKKARPQIEVKIIQPLSCLGSSLPIWRQVDAYINAMKPYFKKYPDGVHIIGHSLGSLIARAIATKCPDHNIRTLVHLNGPINGMFGIPVFGSVLPIVNTIKPLVNLMGHFKFLQELFGIPSLWHDLYHEDHYLRENPFLPQLNNLINHGHNKQYKENFLKIKKFIVVSVTKDTFITPEVSNRGGFYDTYKNIIEPKDHVIYTNDTFGLKTLDEQKKLEYVMWDAGHNTLCKSKRFVHEVVIPSLD